MLLSVIVPTFNEAPNVRPLVERIQAAVDRLDAEIVFVDDSTDGTPREVEAAARRSTVPIRLIHRSEATGGLSGAVIAGIDSSAADWCLVMDGDLQHPPELIPVLLESGRASAADVVVASRYCAGGSSAGLAGGLRRVVSTASSVLARSMFPARLRNCSDPMTGFFAVRRRAIDTGRLAPRGFKILLEILARHRLRVVEEPFVFAERLAGASKADLRQGARYLAQLAALRFGRLSRFNVIGAAGALANLAIMAALIASGADYVLAAIVAAGVTILGNFFAAERFVFRDLRQEGRSFWVRFATSIGFNSLEAAIRLPLLAVLVETLGLPSVPAQAATLLAAFLARFVFHARVVYRPRRTAPLSALLARDTSPLAEPDARKAA